MDMPDLARLTVVMAMKSLRAIPAAICRPQEWSSVLGKVESAVSGLEERGGAAAGLAHEEIEMALAAVEKGIHRLDQPHPHCPPQPPGNPVKPRPGINYHPQYWPLENRLNNGLPAGGLEH